MKANFNVEKSLGLLAGTIVASIFGIPGSALLFSAAKITLLAGCTWNVIAHLVNQDSCTQSAKNALREASDEWSVTRLGSQTPQIMLRINRTVNALLKSFMLVTSKGQLFGNSGKQSSTEKREDNWSQISGMRV